MDNKQSIGDTMRRIAEFIKSKLPDKWGFVVLTYPFNDESLTANYISNSNKEDVLLAMEAFIAHSRSSQDKETSQGGNIMHIVKCYKSECPNNDNGACAADDITISLNGQCDVLKSNEPELTVKLPDGRVLKAMPKDSDYPGIMIQLINANTDSTEDIIAWVEYNARRHDYTEEERLRIMAWCEKYDEPTINLCYATGVLEKD